MAARLGSAGRTPPQRRCIGCGRITSKPDLMRIVATRDGAAKRAVYDPAGCMPGRGAYLCRAEATDVPSADCLANALRRGGIPRALRSAVKLDPKLVESISQ